MYVRTSEDKSGHIYVKYPLKHLYRNHQKCLFFEELSGVLVPSMFYVFKGTYRSCGWCSSGCIWNDAWLCWHGEPESVNQLSSWKSSTNVSQDAVLFLDHVVVSVDGLLTVRLMLSPSYLMVCYVSLNLVKIISMWPFCLLCVDINAVNRLRVLVGVCLD